MTQELTKLREALRRVKYEAASLADAQVIALEALTQRPAAQAVEREVFESVLIDGVAYDVHAPVAAELLRLHIELQALPTQLAQNDAFFVLDDEAKAMIVNSHHYTPENIRALIEQLKSFADPTTTNQADWDNLDWRGFCNVLWRVMMGLSCDLPTQPAAQADSMGMPTSCGKPLCSPDEHHPLCKLHKPAAQATPDVPETDFGKMATPEPVGEAVAEVVWYDPQLDHFPRKDGHKIIDASMAFMDAAPLGTKLYTRPAPGVPDVEAAAKKLAECMGYPWEHMPSAGRVNMRKHAEAVLAAAQAKGGEHA